MSAGCCVEEMQPCVMPKSPKKYARSPGRNDDAFFNFAILLGFLFACFSHTFSLSLSHMQTQKHIDCLRGSEAINM